MKIFKPLLFIVAFAMFMYACKSKQTDTNASTSIPPLTDTINDSTAQRLVNNFDGRAYKVMKLSGPMPDTRCVWFSLKQLKALVARIDSEGGDGIRFYSAAYDKTKKPDTHKINPDYYDYATLVMVSTRAVPANNKDTLHFDYYTSLKGDNGKFTNKGAILMSSPENTGELCPPPSKCVTQGATLLQ